jgi:CheY-like chemotaxis protein
MADLLRRSLGPTIQIITDFRPGLAPARADPNQLELALLNLAVNARDAMPLGGRLAIIARRAAVPGDDGAPGLPPGEYVCVSVRDTGTGMDEATLARATEPFFTTKGVGKGTGLGLSMVHGLAAQSGGALRIASRSGEGTTVELWLPVAEVAGAGREADSTAPSPPAATRACRILVVDDDPLITAGTAAMLEDLGHTVIEVPSAEAALDILEAGGKVDLVITDHAMPGMTGAELARRIRDAWPGLPVILASGYADLPDGEERGLRRLAKPYHQEDVAAQIAEVIGALPPGNVVSIEAARRA